MDDVEFEKRLPDVPFDMTFFVGKLQQMSRQRKTLEALLNGQSIAAASGWHIDGT